MGCGASSNDVQMNYTLLDNANSPKFPAVIAFLPTQDSQIDKQFSEISNIIAKIKSTSFSWKQSLERINKCIGRKDNHADVLHFLKIIVSAISARNNGDKHLFESFRVIDEAPYFVGELGKAKNNQDIKRFMHLYTPFIDHSKALKSSIEQCLALMSRITASQAEQQQKIPSSIDDSSMGKNILSMNSYRDKIKMLLHSIVLPITTSHSQVASNNEYFLRESLISGEVLCQYNMYEMSKIAKSITLLPHSAPVQMAS